MSDDFPNRQSLRLQEYDYSCEGLYFITICTLDHENLFGRIENGIMIFNEYGKIVENEILNTSKICPNIKIDQYTIMPNHLHLIIQIQNPINRRGGVFPPDALNTSNNLNTTDSVNTRKSEESIINILNNTFQNIELQSGISLNSDRGMKFNKKNDILLPNDIEPDGIVESGGKTPPLRLGQIIALMKYRTTAKYNEMMNIKNRKYLKLWQRNYYEHIIRNEKSYNLIVDYIENNAGRWEKDKFYRN